MRVGEVIVFKINKPRHPNCRLTQHTYTVTKKSQGLWGFTIEFYASINGQAIASGTCSPGRIRDISVADHPINAKNCGISSVLTQLCLIDPELNYLYHASRPNEALEFLGKYPEQHGLVQEYCKGLMGMLMTARPPKGAHGYFNAALRSGYRRMLVLANNKFHYFWVQTAKERFDSGPETILPNLPGLQRPKIGLIDEACCNEGCEKCSCDAWGKEWIFCKDI